MDKDLASIQDVRDLLARAVEAQRTLASFSQTDVDRVCKAMTEAGWRHAEELARLAVDETGYGKVADKTTKNRVATELLWESIRDLKTVGVISEDRERRVVEIAEPMGVVAAIVPSTNPTSTAMYKAIISIKSRNAVVISPHPAAARCIAASTDVLRKAAVEAGAPADAVACMARVDMAGTRELMHHPATSVILATGGGGLVRAAYSAGKPAYGVGPGNVPAFIERSADIPDAVRYVIASKTFDYGTLCSSEQAIVTEAAIGDAVRLEVQRQGGLFLSPEQARKLQSVLIVDQRINPALVGRAPKVLAEAAGFQIPDATRVLIADLDRVGWEAPLSMEKLSPVLGFYVENDWLEGCKRCIELLRFGGMGHSLAIHSRNPEVIRAFAFKKPAFRILVNTGSSQGTVGFTTGLSPALTLGCGTLGGNITADNVTPRHLLNVKRVAWGIRDLEGKPISDGAVPWSFAESMLASTPAWPSPDLPVAAEARCPKPAGPVPARLEIPEDKIKAIVSEVLRQFRS
ncbi:MAG: acetaldehyde dehydrogenase (acetylating) [Candidatus Schekmanbacteria bacterium]|nr:acetaldehyde dehydrogenase (acetylating) [Candidatus Schekmanbacteria bacterium]